MSLHCMKLCCLKQCRCRVVQMSWLLNLVCQNVMLQLHAMQHNAALHNGHAVHLAVKLSKARLARASMHRAQLGV